MRNIKMKKVRFCAIFFKNLIHEINVRQMSNKYQFIIILMCTKKEKMCNCKNVKIEKFYAY